METAYLLSRPCFWDMRIPSSCAQWVGSKQWQLHISLKSSFLRYTVYIALPWAHPSPRAFTLCQYVIQRIICCHQAWINVDLQWKNSQLVNYCCQVDFSISLNGRFLDPKFWSKSMQQSWIEGLEVIKLWAKSVGLK